VHGVPLLLVSRGQRSGTRDVDDQPLYVGDHRAVGRNCSVLQVLSSKNIMTAFQK